MEYIITMILAAVCINPLKKINVDRDKKSYKYKSFFIIISFMILLIPQACRYGIGTDYFYTYYPYFNLIGNGERFFTEIGFNLLNKIIYLVTGEFQYLIVITSFLFLFFIYKGILDNSKDITFSVLLLFIGQAYFYSMNMVRQSIAIAIVFFAIKYLKNKQNFKYTICCLIASTFHISALVMILMIFINKIKIERKTRLFILLGILICSPLLSAILKSIIMQTKYSWYFDSDFAKDKVSIIAVGLNLLVFLLDFVLYNNKKDENNFEYNMYSNICFCGMALIIIAYSIPLLNRLIRYISIFHVLHIPLLMKLEKKSKMNLLLKTIVFNCFFIAMYYQIFILGGEGVLPYESIFDVRS